MSSFKFLDNLGGTWENARESLRDDLLQFAAEIAQLQNASAAAHALLDGSSANDTVATAATRGALMVGTLPVGSPAPKWSSLPIGVNHRLLKSNGTDPSWSQASLTADVSGVLPTANGGTGVDIASATLPLGGGQIAFPSTQIPSAGLNTLDDYEEGSWTPNDASGAGLTLTGVVGDYIKIGKLVFVNAVFLYPVTASGAAAIIGGLPFTAKTVQPGGGGAMTFSNNGIHTLVFVRENTTHIELFSTAGAALTNAQMSGTVNIASATYIASA
jgi:hypothetical protein